MTLLRLEVIKLYMDRDIPSIVILHLLMVFFTQNFLSGVFNENKFFCMTEIIYACDFKIFLLY